MGNQYLKFNTKYTNCLFHTLSYQLQKYNLDPLEYLIQPLGFGLDIDLMTRQWWLGSYTELNYFSPYFSSDLTGDWYKVKSKDLKQEIMNYQGKLVMKPEWFYLEHCPHYKKNWNDIHVLGIERLNIRDNNVLIFDRYVKKEEYIRKKFVFEVPLENLERGSDNEHLIFKWNIKKRKTNSKYSKDRKLKKLFEESYYNYNISKLDLQPHVHYLQGMDALEGMVKCLRMIPNDFYDDKHTFYSIYTQLPFNIEQFIIPNKQRFLYFLIKYSKQKEFSNLKECLICSINEWEHLLHLLKKQKLSISGTVSFIEKIIIIEKKIKNNLKNIIGE